MLLLGTLAAVGVHVIALFMPFTQALLDIKPLPISEWLMLAAVAATIVLVMEIHKAVRAPKSPKRPRPARA